MPKLHQLLAVDASQKGQAQKCRAAGAPLGFLGRKEVEKIQ